MSAISILEQNATEVTIDYGLKIMRYYDIESGSRYWRVILPKWVMKGSWLDYQHGFSSLESAIDALHTTGTIEALEEYWKALSAQSRAQQKAFRSIMDAHSLRDKSFDRKLEV